MLTEAFTYTLYMLSFLSLIFVDYLLGNGFFDAFKKILCKVVCFVRKSLKEQDLQVTEDVHLPLLIVEVLVLGLSISILNKYKKFRCKDRIDDLLQQSREALQQTNEFLEKWRLRRYSSINLKRNSVTSVTVSPVDAVNLTKHQETISQMINWQVPNDYTYLDEEPQDIKPLKLELPILHLAIIDSLGASMNKLERGDGGDNVKFTDSILSVTSLLGDLHSIPEVPSDEIFQD